MADTKKIVIVGAGVGARNVVKAFPTRGFDVTVIQPNDFAEFPFSGPLTLAYPEMHSNVVTGQAIPNVKTIAGIATGMSDGILTVKSLCKDETQEVKFDYIIAASGFQFPKFLATPGQTYEERVQEIQSFNDAALSGGDIVVGGGGIIAIEMACNMCEIVNKKTAADSGFNAKVKIVTSGNALCPTYDAKYQALAKTRFEALGGEVIFNDRVTSHNEPFYNENMDKFTIELKSSKTIENVGLYIPSFIGKGSNDYLSSMEGVLDPNSNKVILDEYLMSKTYKKLFALGGCAQLLTPESFLGAAKIEEQAKSIVKNIKCLVANQPMVAHKEGLPDLKNGVAILMGHHSYATWVPEVMPACPACVCKTCGPPCNLLCPCFCCAVLCGKCDIGCCGCCCGAPEGSGVAAGFRKFTLAGIGAGMMGFNGIGSAMPPASQRITRS
jgi:NADH dehydrogenase FAD-containing subunit